MINLHSLIRNSYQPLPILQILVKQLRLIPSFQIDLIISFDLNFFYNVNEFNCSQSTVPFRFKINFYCFQYLQNYWNFILTLEFPQNGFYPVIIDWITDYLDSSVHWTEFNAYFIKQLLFSFFLNHRRIQIVQIIRTII